MIGLGLDLCEIARMEKLLAKDDSFLNRYFTKEEQAYVKGRGQLAAHSMAALFAAKEAFLKALGLGIGGGVELTEVAVHHQADGRPVYALTGKAAELLAERGGCRAHLSLSHEAGVAAAVALLE